MMSEPVEDVEELLFFDTFSHEVNEDLNLDLVQFPKPVYITEVRIIPLGARVQADFPGGVRLGATNPSKFHIEFFVNDLGKPGASTFECLGDFDYNQNDCIHLECVPSDPTVRQIPTDGLVLRGWYTTITLAVYGKLTKAITEPIIAAPVEDAVQALPGATAVVLPVVDVAVEGEFATEDAAFEVATVSADAVFYEEPAVAVTAKRQHAYKDRIRSSSESEYDREEGSSKKEHARQSNAVSASNSANQEQSSSSRHRTTSHRDRSRSSSRERDYHRSSKRDWSHSPDYRHSSSRRTRTTSYDQRYSKRDRSRDRDRRQESDKRPRTPPMVSSPRLPRTPERSSSAGIESASKSSSDHHDKARKYDKVPSSRAHEHVSDSRTRSPSHPKTQETIPLVKSPSPDVILDDTSSQQAPEVFEPILSDDEIGDEAPAEAEPIFDDSDIDYASLDDVLCPFDPNRDPLEKFNTDILDEKELELNNKILQKITERDQFCITSHEFLELPAESQELWVHSAEHLLQALHLIHNFPFAKRSEMLTHLVENHTDTIVSLIKIGLDWDCAMAQPQPVFRLRHLKIGARLVEMLGGCNELIAVILFREQYDLFATLFGLYGQQYMAVSIRLQLIKAMYACLDSKVAMDYCLSGGTTPVYQRVIEVLQSDPPTRAKFALRSLLKKVNLYESLQLLREIVSKIFVARNFENQSVDHQLITATLEEIQKAYDRDSISYSQPKRFLPVAAKYEIARDKSADRSAAFSFHTYFECHAFLETLLLLVANRVSLPQSIVALSLDLLETLARSPAGLDYFYTRIETTGVLVKCLLDEQVDSVVRESRARDLGLEIAYKVKSKYYLEAITNIAPERDADLTNVLHAFYALLSHPKSRPHGVATVAMDANVLILVDVIERERKIEQSQIVASDGASVKLQSPIIGYAFDALETTLRYSSHLDYLAEHGLCLVDLVKSSTGVYDDSIAQVLQEMSIFLKPLDLPNVFAYDNILPLCEQLKQSVEFIITFPGDLITIIRLMHHLAVGRTSASIEPEPMHFELKHKYVVLQMFSCDGVSVFCSVLDKICAHYEQPALHSTQLATQQGVIITQILLPAVNILQRMLTYVIRSRDSQFRDLTAIPSLLRTFTLAHHIPPHSLAAGDATRIQHAVILTLMAYTQPNPPEGVDTETVHKSLWTQMISELLKYTLSGPCNYMSGLQALSELLPATLPVISVQPLLETEMGRLITERQLWSAHLHPKSPEITDLLQTIAPTTQPALQHLLHRVCLQLADLAPNMSLLVAKSLVELILMEEPHSQVQLLRLLIRLVGHGTIKVSLLSMLPGKFSELLVTILKIGTNPIAQALVFELIQGLMDPDVALDNTQLPNALPSKEVLALFVVAAVECFLATRSVVALRTMQRMTRIDLPLFLLRSVLDTRKEQLNTVLEATELEPMLDFLIDFVDVKSKHRTSELGPNDLAIILNWRRPLIKSEPADPADPSPVPVVPAHPIQRMAEADVPPGVRPKLQTLLDKLAQSDVQPELSELPEPALGLADGIVQQFTGRQLIQLCDQLDENHEYWPKLQADVRTDGAALVVCDLSEVIKVCLSIDTNVTSECKRLLHLSASPQSTRERTQTAPCFRTRRVDVEPTTGRMDKKIFVTRGRGFARSQPNRSDLFRSRPPNTSRPPSLHVDDFLALETCGAQPTGPTGYNKMSRDIISIRGSRGGRGRGGGASNSSGNAFSVNIGGDRVRLGTMATNSVYRQNNRRNNSPGNWTQNAGVIDPSSQSPQHFRTATAEPVVGGGSSHFSINNSSQDYSSTSNGNSSHFSSMQRGRSRGGGNGGSGARPQRPFQR